MSNDLKLTVLSPERKLAQEISVRDVVLFTSEGQVQILPGHAEIIGTLVTGPFAYSRTDGQVAGGAISTGFFRLMDNQVIVMAETIEFSGEIDFDRARRAQKIAEDMLKDATIEESKFLKYQLKLQRALIRQQVAAR